MSLKPDEQVISLKVRKVVIDLIDKDRERFRQSKTAWVTQAIVEKLERLGYEINY